MFVYIMYNNFMNSSIFITTRTRKTIYIYLHVHLYIHESISAVKQQLCAIITKLYTRPH